MEYCSACLKSPATIMIMDLSAGSVVDQQHLCGPCAEDKGIVNKSPIKVPPEMFEALLNTMQGKSVTEVVRGKAGIGDCPGCGMTLNQFKTSGRLGCPRCYTAFRDDLVPLLQRVHEAASHRGRLPGGTPPSLPEAAAAEAPPAAQPTPETDVAARRREALASLRRQLDEAIRGERYEEAARLRDELHRAESDEGRA